MAPPDRGSSQRSRSQRLKLGPALKACHTTTGRADASRGEVETTALAERLMCPRPLERPGFSTGSAFFSNEERPSHVRW